jgi:hypothetical protein
MAPRGSETCRNVLCCVCIFVVLCTCVNGKLNVLYTSPTIMQVIKSRLIRWAGYVALMGEGRGVYRVLVGKPEGKRPLWRPRRRWEDNINLLAPEFGI